MGHTSILIYTIFNVWTDGEIEGNSPRGTENPRPALAGLTGGASRGLTRYDDIWVAQKEKPLVNVMKNNVRNYRRPETTSKGEPIMVRENNDENGFDRFCRGGFLFRFVFLFLYGGDIRGLKFHGYEVIVVMNIDVMIIFVGNMNRIISFFLVEVLFLC